jgi:hypothetical protein
MQCRSTFLETKYEAYFG